MIRKLLKVFDGTISILTAAADPDFAPLTRAFLTGANPC